MSKKRGLNSKVYWTVSISCVVTVAVLASVYLNVRTMIQLQEQTSKAQLRMARFNRLTTFMVDMETGERGFMLSGDMSYLDPYNTAEEAFNQYVRETEPMMISEAKQAERLKEIVSLKAKWIEGPAVQEMIARRKVNAGRLTQEEFIGIFKASDGKMLTDKIRTLASEAVAEEEGRIQEDHERAGLCANRIVLWSSFALFCILTGFGSIAWVTGRLSKSILKLISDLAGVTESLRTAAGQIAEDSEQLLIAGEKQSSSIQVTASSIEEMSSMTEKTTTNAKRSEEVATTSKEIANRGRISTEEMRRAIEEIQTSNERITRQVEESNKNIEGIVGVIAEIGNKAKVINDIVFQTKLLSFNASVEAARAGEHGKGFSVVAEEVGVLARTSGDAAREIDQMLKQGIERVRSVILQTRTGVESIIAESSSKINSGTLVAKQCGKILEDIMSNVSEVHGSVTEISTAMLEQSLGVSEINQAIQEIDQLTTKNNQISVSTTESARDLLNQAEMLGRVVNLLSLEIHGGAEQTSPDLQARGPESSETLDEDLQIAS